MVAFLLFRHHNITGVATYLAAHSDEIGQLHGTSFGRRFQVHMLGATLWHKASEGIKGSESLGKEAFRALRYLSPFR